MDLIHPHTPEEVAQALRECSRDDRRVLVVGGRTHMDRGNPVEVDAELWTTQMNDLVAYEPAEMIAVAQAGMRVGDLQAELARGDQEWPVDGPAEATVGGVIAAGISSVRRLRVGHIRDTVVELQLVTGDGRLVKSGARTVKNVTGFDIHRLVTGSLGTLGCIVRAAIKLRPLPRSRVTLALETDRPLELGNRMLESIPLPVAVLARPGKVEVRLEGWPEEVEEQVAAARGITGDLAMTDGEPFPTQPVDDAPVVVEVAVPPSRIPVVVAGHESWTALLGVGLVWFRLAERNAELAALRGRVAEAGGIAPVIRGPGGLGDPPLPAPDVHRRLKDAFDPAEIMAPGRFWGAL